MTSPSRCAWGRAALGGGHPRGAARRRRQGGGHSAAVARPEFLREAADEFGCQCVVLAIDAA